MPDRCRFLTQVGDGRPYSCYPELPWCDADEASLRQPLGLPEGLFLDIVATCSGVRAAHVARRANTPGFPPAEGAPSP